MSEANASGVTVEEAGARRSVTHDNVVEFTGVDLDTPSGQRLVSDLTFRVGRHQHVFLHGPNGAGKTTLFRLMCGIVEASAGHVATPPRSACFYVPQRSYLIPGSLRDQLLYPDTTASATYVCAVWHGAAAALVVCKRSHLERWHPCRAEASTLDTSVERLMHVLKLVGLERLAPTPAALNSSAAWGTLSSGERQRIGIARLLVHQPTFAMLDECTNHLNESFEAWVYSHCKELGITLFTVSHRTQLRRFHEFDLHLRGDGSYSFTRIAADQ